MDAEQRFSNNNAQEVAANNHKLSDYLFGAGRRTRAVAIAQQSARASARVED
jgi:hypothetical protein